MEHESSNIPLSKQVFSIPNLIGYFRIILIPIIVWNYMLDMHPIIILSRFLLLSQESLMH